jgi:SAM-dependent methyltransferase
VLTVDFERLGVGPGARVLDLGCGGGRHAFEAWRRGATVVALDRSDGELKDVLAVPTRWPERVCWALDHRYHDTPGGHVRIYRQRDLEAKLEAAGCWLRGSHHAHALHSPYWWLQCALGAFDRVDRPWAVRQYHRLLVRQIEGRAPGLAALERALNPVLGKSLVVYAQRVRA